MPPFSNDIDMSFSSQEGLFDKTTDTTPLHEGTTLATTRRLVSFNSMAIVYDVMGLDDYTPDELEASWLNRDDMHRMKDTARSDARLHDSGLLVKDKIRGIEQKTREGIMRKRLHRNGAYSAIFCEIAFQQEEEILDEDSIMDAYMPYSSPCSIAARLIGEQDAKDAMNIFMQI